MKKLFQSILLFFILLFVTETALEARQQIQTPEISAIFRNIAEISDPSTIQLILNDFLIPESVENIERVEIIDVSNIGFGDNDILIVYPSLNVYMLDSPSSPELVEAMLSWSIEEQRRDADNTLTADYFYPAHADTLEAWEVEETQMELVQNSLISDILVSLNRNYTQLPISFRFERDNSGFTFQMWNYNENAFTFSPRPPGIADSVAVNDFLYVLYSDSTVIADTTLYDVIYINKSVQETVYMPPFVEQQIIQTQSLPGSGSAFQSDTENGDANIRRD